MLLVDTDVLIWHLRGYPKATRQLDQLPKLTISVITYLKLLQGLRNRAEMLALQKSLEMRNTDWVLAAEMQVIAYDPAYRSDPLLPAVENALAGTPD